MRTIILSSLALGLALLALLAFPASAAQPVPVALRATPVALPTDPPDAVYPTTTPAPTADAYPAPYPAPEPTPAAPPAAPTVRPTREPPALEQGGPCAELRGPLASVCRALAG